MKAFKLDPSAITSVEDVAAILNGLGLVMRDDAPMFGELSQFFTIDVTPPEGFGESEAAIAQED